MSSSISAAITSQKQNPIMSMGVWLLSPGKSMLFSLLQTPVADLASSKMFCVVFTTRHHTNELHRDGKKRKALGQIYIFLQAVKIHCYQTSQAYDTYYIMILVVKNKEKNPQNLHLTFKKSSEEEIHKITAFTSICRNWEKENWIKPLNLTWLCSLR